MIVTTSQELQSLRRNLLNSPEPIAVDTETNYTDKYQERYLLGISLYVNNESYYIPVETPDWKAPHVFTGEGLSDLFSGVQSELVFHNEGFDRKVLENAGIKVPDKSYDTMLMSQLINEDEFITKKAHHSLDSCAKVYLNEEFSKEVAAARQMRKFGWEQIPPSIMAKYAEKDAQVTYELYKRLKPKFNLYEDYWEPREHDITRFLMGMVSRGIPIDREATRVLRDACVSQCRELKDAIGFDPKKLGEARKKLFGESPYGLGIEITHRTPSGLPQINKDFLKACNHPIAGLIKQYNQTFHKMSNYYNPYMEQTSDDYQRLHPYFAQHGTETGRWSSNFHQLPRDSLVKTVFRAEPGRQLWEIDYRNLEWRFAAVLSNETSLIELFRNEGDLHALNSELLNISRQDAKIGGFTALFMGGAKAIHDALDVPIEVAQKFMKDFRSGYPEINKTMRRAEGACQNNGGWIRLWTGRRRHYQFSSEYYTAFNALVQGGSFELVKDSILKADEAGVDIRNCVHDSVWIMSDNENEVIEAQHILEDWTEEAFGLRFSTDRKRLN